MNLLGEDLTESTTHNCEVLAEDKNLATINCAPTSDHTICIWLVGETGGMGAVARKHVEFVEGAWVEEVLDALTSKEFPP